MTKPVIVLAEDQDAIRALLVIELKVRGYDVHAVADGAQAKTVIADLRPDAILLDLMMPHVDGIEVLEWLRSDPELRQTAVIVLTARSDDDALARATELGVDDYLTKPFDVDDVDEALRRRLVEAS